MIGMRERTLTGHWLRRPLRHWTCGAARARRLFPPEAIRRLEQAVKAGETTHRAEVRIVIEPRLDGAALRARLDPRARALQVFAEQGVWDTEGNNGVLLYLLLADHAVEIVADRAAARAVPADRWREVCDALVHAYRREDWLDGTLAAVEQIHALLAQAFPAGSADAPPDVDELPNRPVIL